MKLYLVLVIALCAFVISTWGTPSYPAGPIEHLRFYGDGATVIKVDGIPKEVVTLKKIFQPLHLDALIAGKNVQVHGDNCTRGVPFDEFTVYP